uniref:Uncharacterized protein n=1 Tax=Meloidogyne javanica TaxID=6303 RepID=A0A915M264_MELJA
MDGLNGENNGGGAMDEEDEHPSHEQPQHLFQEDDGQGQQQPEVLFLEDEYEQKFQPEEEEEGEWTSLNDQVLEEEKNEGEDEHSLVVDNSIERIEAHKKDVFCLSLSKNERWLATGSEDDTAAVWDANQKPIRQHLHIVGKHVDSVHCLAWNCSSDLLASGDMSGRIVCTLLKDSIEIEPSTLIVFEVNLPGSCTGAMDLHLSGNMAAFGCSNGQIALVTINLIDQKLKLIHVFTTSNKKEEENEEEENNKNNCSVECIKFFPGNFPWLAGGMANGKLIIFNWEHLTGRYEFFNE